MNKKVETSTFKVGDIIVPKNARLAYTGTIIRIEERYTVHWSDIGKSTLNKDWAEKEYRKLTKLERILR